MRFVGKALLIFLLGIAALAFVRAMHDGDKSSAAVTTQGAESREAAEQKAESVSAIKLFMDYQSNEVAADNVYKGHRLAVRGTVTSISKDAFDKIYVSLATPNEFMNVQAYVDKGSAAEAAGLHRGQLITAICTGNGLIVGSPMLQDCSFAKPEVEVVPKTSVPSPPGQETEHPANSEPPANQPSNAEADPPSE